MIFFPLQGTSLNKDYLSRIHYIQICEYCITKKTVICYFLLFTDEVSMRCASREGANHRYYVKSLRRSISHVALSFPHVGHNNALWSTYPNYPHCLTIDLTWERSLSSEAGLLTSSEWQMVTGMRTADFRRRQLTQSRDSWRHRGRPVSYKCQAARSFVFARSVFLPRRCVAEKLPVGWIITSTVGWRSYARILFIHPTD